MYQQPHLAKLRTHETTPLENETKNSTKRNRARLQRRALEILAGFSRVRLGKPSSAGTGRDVKGKTKIFILRVNSRRPNNEL